MQCMFWRRNIVACDCVYEARNVIPGQPQLEINKKNIHKYRWMRLVGNVAHIERRWQLSSLWSFHIFADLLVVCDERHAYFCRCFAIRSRNSSFCLCVWFCFWFPCWNELNWIEGTQKIRSAKIKYWNMRHGKTTSNERDREYSLCQHMIGTWIRLPQSAWYHYVSKGNGE